MSLFCCLYFVSKPLINLKNILKILMSFFTFSYQIFPNQSWSQNHDWCLHDFKLDIHTDVNYADSVTPKSIGIREISTSLCDSVSSTLYVRSYLIEDRGQVHTEIMRKNMEVNPHLDVYLRRSISNTDLTNSWTTHSKNLGGQIGIKPYCFLFFLMNS